MKRSIIILAISVLTATAAHANGMNVFIGGGGGGGNDAAKAGYPGAIERGNSQAWTPAANGVPIIILMNSRVRPIRNFQPGPFHELGPNDKVEWRR